jgi:hypothetical protein
MIKTSDIPLLITTLKPISIKKEFCAFEFPCKTAILNINIHGDKTIGTSITMENSTLDLDDVDEELDEPLFLAYIGAVEEVVEKTFDINKLMSPETVSKELNNAIDALDTMGTVIDSPEMDRFLDNLMKVTEKVIVKAHAKKNPWFALISKVEALFNGKD